MQISESWLRTFVDPPLSSDDLAHVLTMGGLEVEEISGVATEFSGVVVARIEQVDKHPNADRLNVCKVDVGQAELLSIVCGAPNARPGIKVPCALIGAQLPGGQTSAAPFEIKRAKMRGVESEGMLCSARELKLSDDAGGLMILDENARVGAALREVLGLDDRIFTLKLTPNKADCLSVLGVAREVSALTGAALSVPEFTALSASIDDRLAVEILAPDLCGRFSGRIIRGVDAKAGTPEWMRQRLMKSGQRSISALVDISNYVMLELGRPTHIFDLSKIEGGLTVRWGKRGERLKLLNGATVDIDEDIGVIADQRRVESLAGIMGGDATAVSLETTDIYLEAAFWWPAAIQGRARRYNFSTDAAHRFERGVDPSTTVAHIERISQLIVEICGGKAGPVTDDAINMPAKKAIPMRVTRASRVIGIPLDGPQVASFFERLNFAFTRDGDRFMVTAPAYRFDIEVEEDLIEEVARLYGFDNIPAHLPVARHVMLAQEEACRTLHDLRRELAASDYQEVINFSFVEADWERDFGGNDDPIRLVNPIASPLSVMRSMLIPSLVANVRYNLNRKAARVRVFEIAKVFLRTPGSVGGDLTLSGVGQPTHVAGLAYGPAVDDQWGLGSRPVDFYDVKSDVEQLFGSIHPHFVRAEHPAFHPGRSARIEVEGQTVGWMGEMHPSWLQKYELPEAPIGFEIDASALLKLGLPKLAEIGKFPAATRDLSVVIEQSIEAQALLDEIDAVRKTNGAAGLIQDVLLFDQYRGKGLKNNEKSIAFRFRLQDTRQTLSDEVVELALAAVIRALHDKFGATPRI